MYLRRPRGAHPSRTRRSGPRHPIRVLSGALLSLIGGAKITDWLLLIVGGLSLLVLWRQTEIADMQARIERGRNRPRFDAAPQPGYVPGSMPPIPREILLRGNETVARIFRVTSTQFASSRMIGANRQYLCRLVFENYHTQLGTSLVLSGESGYFDQLLIERAADPSLNLVQFAAQETAIRILYEDALGTQHDSSYIYYPNGSTQQVNQAVIDASRAEATRVIILPSDNGFTLAHRLGSADHEGCRPIMRELTRQHHPSIGALNPPAGGGR